MELLSIRGRTDVGLDLAFQTDYPSWGYMASMNSTTVWEHWEYMNGGGMNSHNHPALASVGAWLWRWVLGLRLADGTIDTPDHAVYGKGFKKVLFAPGCVTDARLPSSTGRITTIFGPIEVVSGAFSSCTCTRPCLTEDSLLVQRLFLPRTRS
jgi:hypothetical protein